LTVIQQLLSQHNAACAVLIDACWGGTSPSLATLRHNQWCAAAAAAACRDLLQLLLPPILGVDAAKAAAAAPGEILATLTDSHVGRLLRDECYSHLLEVSSINMLLFCLYNMSKHVLKVVQGLFKAAAAAAAAPTGGGACCCNGLRVERLLRDIRYSHLLKITLLYAVTSTY
jgi:hypothetical protein